MNDRIDRIRALLVAALAPERIEISDDSHLHQGHLGARDGRGHFSVMIVAAVFSGRSLLQRHRMVYAALNEVLERDVHALSIKAHSPEEIPHNQSTV